MEKLYCLVCDTPMDHKIKKPEDFFCCKECHFYYLTEDISLQEAQLKAAVRNFVFRGVV